MTPELLVGGNPANKIKFRITLALSGGGFRASIFHLGVIRRLEELGIMKDVDAISAVSGGSIVTAYYVCEMEKRLRQEDPATRNNPETRVRVFEAIAADFLKAVDHNLRTRALVFTPFFHPWLFIKTLALKPFRAGARSELIQKEYDRWFYDGDTIDQLPSVTPEKNLAGDVVVHGPQVLLNTTSLLTGERVSFSRVPVSGVSEMKRPNRNSLPLSRVVGASSGVPVVFPPTHIYGDILVDGGVADNQGIEALLATLPAETDTLPDMKIDVEIAERLGVEGMMLKELVKQNVLVQPANRTRIADVLLVSDASGQMEPIHTISSGESDVFFRVNEILQFQVRSKILARLVDWHKSNPDTHYFAFTHLFLNLKDRGVVQRLPVEMIPGVARIRTDLDQFSFIERDALMYHGYTTIDAQIKKYCEPLTVLYAGPQAPNLAAPALFDDSALETMKNRDTIRRELEAGAEKLFLLRSLKKHPKRVVPVMMLWAAALAGVTYLLFSVYKKPLELTQRLITNALEGLTSGWVGKALDWVLAYAQIPSHDRLIHGIAPALGALAIFSVAGYVLAFPMYLAVRNLVLHGDRVRYRKLTGENPGTAWRVWGDDQQRAKKATA